MVQFHKVIEVVQREASKREVSDITDDVRSAMAVLDQIALIGLFTDFTSDINTYIFQLELDNTGNHERNQYFMIAEYLPKELKPINLMISSHYSGAIYPDNALGNCNDCKSGFEYAYLESSLSPSMNGVFYATSMEGAKLLAFNNLMDYFGCDTGTKMIYPIAELEHQVQPIEHGNDLHSIRAIRMHSGRCYEWNGQHTKMEEN